MARASLFLLSVVLVAAPTARADPYTSAGVSIGIGNGFAFVGVEVTEGAVERELVPSFGGLSAGVEVALTRQESDRPLARFYVELEGGLAGAGAGAGPALLLTDGHLQLAVQLTPFVSMSNITGEMLGFPPCQPGPFWIVSPFYRYTWRSRGKHLHEAGLFLKGLWIDRTSYGCGTGP